MKMKYTLLIVAALSLSACFPDEPTTNSTGNVERKAVEVQTDSQGWTVEQKNIANRLKRDNTPGSIKHLYIISPYSGQVLVYSTVKGKVTSSGKRLTPNTVAAADGEFVHSPHNGIPVNISGETKATSEVLQDDGTYGSSCEYIYWFDATDRYHQHFFTGGQIIHVSEQPLNVKNVTINMEESE